MNTANTQTPSKLEKILAAGIRRVVVAMRDPNPGVKGGGTQRVMAVVGRGHDDGVHQNPRDGDHLRIPGVVLDKLFHLHKNLAPAILCCLCNG